MIRHGQAANPDSEGRVYNYSEAPLTETGSAQAREVADLLRQAKIDAVVTSDLARARETAQAIARGHVPVLVDARLREVDIGDFEGMTLPRLGHVDSRFLPWLEVFFNERFASSRFHIPSGLSFPGGESVETMFGRMLPAFREIATAYQGQTAVLVSHAWAIQSLLCHVTGNSLRNYYRFAYANCRVTIVEVDTDGRGALLVQNGNLELDRAAGARLLAPRVGAAPDDAPMGTSDRTTTCRALLIGGEGVDSLKLTQLVGGLPLAAIRASPHASSVAASLGAATRTSPEVDRRLEDPDLALESFRDIVRRGLGSTVALIAEAPILSLLAAHITGAGAANADRFPALAGGVGLVEVEEDGRGMLHIWNGRVRGAGVCGPLEDDSVLSRSSDYSEGAMSGEH